MKILTAAQLREWEEATMSRQGISPAVLMERAAAACADWITRYAPPETPVAVLCGCGLNGGDGLVLTRLLSERGWGVKAFLLRHRSDLSPDAAAALRALRRLDPGAVEELEEGTLFSGIGTDVLLVDAILGLGLTRPLNGWLADVVHSLNARPNFKVAIDLPTGTGADDLIKGPSLHVQHTLTFSTYKRSLLYPESGEHAGEVHVLDIGLDEDFVDDLPGHFFTLDAAYAAALYQPRKPFTHKGTYGTALLIGGSKGMIGAAALATMAASRGGAGKVRAIVPECGYNIIQTLAPEAMCETSGQDFVESFDGWEDATAVGVGPGLRTEPKTVEAFAGFLTACTRPVVLDADALTILSRHPELMKRLPPLSILTPHPKEFERLAGPAGNTMQRTEKARSMAMRYNIYLVVKDRYTVIATPGGACWYNLAGNAGLATAGSGDVLCGLITGLLASGYDPCRAALLGVYLHAKAGEAAAATMGMETVIAGDIVANIGQAFLSLG